MSQINNVLARSFINPDMNNNENYYNVMDTRLNFVVYSLNNFEDAEEIKNCLNRIHIIYSRNNRDYLAFFNNVSPYNIEVIRRVNN